MDRRKNYYLVYDTEATNGLDDPIVYDIGGAIVDKKGNVYEAFSFVISDVFFGLKDLMQTAYYAEKIPNYYDDIEMGIRDIVNFYTAKEHIKNLCDKYNVKAIIAHNGYFDYKATATTQRYLTKSKYRYFLPYGIPLWDTLKMAQDTICKQKSYIKWATDNGYVTKYGKVRATAEILYRYISGDYNFEESHTGLEDVMIEKEIFTHCMRQHKSMRKTVFNKRG